MGVFVYGRKQEMNEMQLLLGGVLKKHASWHIASKDSVVGSRLAEQRLSSVAGPIHTIPGTNMAKTEESERILSFF